MLALVLCAATQLGPGPIVDPAEHASPSGRHVLRVDPSARSGFGPGSHALSKEGEALWSAELPFTLRAAAVTDEGYALGYALTGTGCEEGELVVAVIGPEGEVVLEDRTPRTAVGPLAHGADSPRPLGLVVDSERGRFAVRVAVPSGRPQVEAWWRYAIETGERFEDVHPQRPVTLDDSNAYEIAAARALPGTGLHLLLWTSRPREPFARTTLDEGAAAALVDDRGAVVWEIALRPDGWDGALDEMLELGSEGSFSLPLVHRGQRTRYRATRDDAAQRGWRVEELGREDLGPGERGPAAIAPPPQLELASLGAVELERPVRARRPPLLNACAWTFDGEGGFFVVQRDGGGRFARLHLDRSGARLDRRPFDPLPDPLGGGTSAWHPLGQDRWLVLASGERGGRAVLLAEGSTGSMARLPGTGAGAARWSDGVAASGDGGFVTLPGPTAFDQEGRHRWRARWDDGAAYVRGEDVAVTTRGEVAVLAADGHLHVFDERGRHRRSLRLESLLGSAPHDPSGLSADADGGVLLYDFGGDPPLWHIDLDAGVRGSCSPRFADGRAPEELARRARFAPDGKLWTSDGYALLRLDDGGVVTESVGEAPVPGALYHPGTAAVLPDGRLAIQDQRTGAVHVWAESGELLFVGETSPSDADAIDLLGQVAGAPDGSIWIEDEEGRFLGWSAEGRRLGHRDLGRSVAFAPDGEHSWTWGWDTGVTLRSGSGAALATVDHHPDGRWIRSTGAVCFGPAGEPTVLDRPRYMSGDRGALVATYTAGGGPLSLVPIPAGPRWGERLHRTGDRILRSSWLPTVLVLDVDAGVLGTFEVPDTDERTLWIHGLSDDGRRLLSLDRASLTVYRHALP